MAEIRARYDEIFANCAPRPTGSSTCRTGGGSGTCRREERRAFWDELYEKPGFAFLAGNFPEIFYDEAANREVSEYVAERIRRRVHDPAVAEKLIPRDHGFGTQRLPLETRLLRGLQPRQRASGVAGRDADRALHTERHPDHARHYDLDLIVYATGFDAITGAFDHMDIRGVEGRTLREKWRDGPSTYLGLMTHGFPNLLMVAGPQSVSGSTNFPRAIEVGVEWVTRLLAHVRDRGHHPHRGRGGRPSATGARRCGLPTSGCCCAAARAGSRATTPTSPGTRPGGVRYQAYFGGGPKYRVPAATDMIRHLVAAQEATARTARAVFPVVNEANDQPTADLLTRRLEVHEKTAWMLRSLLE
jgi:hypothetical protein